MRNIFNEPMDVKLIFILFMLTLTPCNALTSECGITPSSTNHVSGVRDELVGIWPWQASIGWNKTLGGQWQHHCGGSLISNTTILTAAHCMGNIDTTRSGRSWLVRLGDHDLDNINDDGGVQIRAIEEYKNHSQYDPRLKYFDVAVITVSNAFHINDNVRPVCLPDVPVSDCSYVDHLAGHHVTVTGYGQLSRFQLNVEQTLGEAHLTIFHQAYCNETHTGGGVHRHNINEQLPNHFSSNVLCAGKEQIAVGSCHGDSGGPLVKWVTNSTGGRPKYYQIGVVQGSFSECGDPSFPGIYARLAHIDIINFVRNAIGEPELNEECGTFLQCDAGFTEVYKTVTGYINKKMKTERKHHDKNLSDLSSEITNLKTGINNEIQQQMTSFKENFTAELSSSVNAFKDDVEIQVQNLTKSTEKFKAVADKLTSLKKQMFDEFGFWNKVVKFTDIKMLEEHNRQQEELNAVKAEMTHLKGQVKSEISSQIKIIKKDVKTEMINQMTTAIDEVTTNVNKVKNAEERLQSMVSGIENLWTGFIKEINEEVRQRTLRKKCVGAGYTLTERDDGTSICYFYTKLSSSKNYDYAKKYCEDRVGGWSLVHIAGPVERSKVYDIISSEQIQIWLAPRKKDSSSEEFIGPSGSSLSYFNWYSSQPNDLNKNDLCILMYYSSTYRVNSWYDYVCTRGLASGIVCQSVLIEE